MANDFRQPWSVPGQPETLPHFDGQRREQRLTNTAVEELLDAIRELTQAIRALQDYIMYDKDRAAWQERYGRSQPNPMGQEAAEPDLGKA